MAARILFVDDEPGIRATFPQILEGHGFQVVTTATVADALREINQQAFDVLIADLNIGEPGDGFTVVSAMRRTQSACRTLILTGYPGFESALEAIRNQVDDYIIKPADIGHLVRSLQQAVKNPTRRSGIERRSISEVLRDNQSEIVEKTLAAMKAHPELRLITLSDSGRTDHVPDLVWELAEQLESANANVATEEAVRAAARHARTRYRQGYSLANLVDDSQLLEQAICETVQQNLLALDLSCLLPDLKRISAALKDRLKASLLAYRELERKAA